MDKSVFWKIVDSSISADQDEQILKLKESLTTLSKDDLIGFDYNYRTMLKEANSWDLWAAAYIINGGCSDDGFDYFKDWLISQGETVFTEALENPETLKGVAKPWDTEFEEFRYAMLDVMEDAHNSDFPVYDEFKWSKPTGNEWDEETVEQKYPKLAAWVSENAKSYEPSEPTIPQPKKSFWQRLFGK